jgi:hypothetical protein
MFSCSGEGREEIVTLALSKGPDRVGISEDRDALCGEIAECPCVKAGVSYRTVGL